MRQQTVRQTDKEATKERQTEWTTQKDGEVDTYMLHTDKYDYREKSIPLN